MTASQRNRIVMYSSTKNEFGIDTDAIRDNVVQVGLYERNGLLRALNESNTNNLI